MFLALSARARRLDAAQFARLAREGFFVVWWVSEVVGGISLVV